MNTHDASANLRPLIVDRDGDQLHGVPQTIELNPDLLPLLVTVADTLERLLRVLNSQLDAANRVVESHGASVLAEGGDAA